MEPGAHAEYLLYEEFLQDGMQASARDVHVRIKVFDGAGAQRCAMFHVDYPQQYGKITELKGRTILPDGRSLPLDSHAIQDQPIVARGKDVMRRRSFAMPSVTAGAIVEYRYRLELTDHWSNRAKLIFRLDLPAQRIAYYFKPLEYPGVRPRTIEFRSPARRSERPIDGWYEFLALRQPAWFEEPDSPPALQVTGWVMLYYTYGDQNRRVTASYWDDIAESHARKFAPSILPDEDARALADSITKRATTAEERVRRLTAWMRSDFHVVESTSRDTLEFYGLLETDNGRVALKQRGGTPEAAQLAFATLAKACSLKVREVRVGNSSEFYFHPNMQDEAFLPNRRVAVRLDAGWYVVDAGAQFLAPDMLDHLEESQIGLLCGLDSAGFVTLPVASPNRSQVRRTADLELLPDGTVRGEITFAVTGHLNDQYRRRYEGVTGAALDTLLRREVNWQADGMLLSDIRIDRGRRGEGEMRIHARAEWPGVATVTSKRVILQPALLEARRPPRFTSSERRLPVTFPFAWTESDSIRIRIPEGWKAEALQAPAPVTSPGLADYSISEHLEDDGRTLVTRRSLVVGYEGNLGIPLENYPDLKKLFERIAEHDRLAVSLVKQ